MSITFLLIFFFALVISIVGWANTDRDEIFVIPAVAGTTIAIALFVSSFVLPWNGTVWDEKEIQRMEVTEYRVIIVAENKKYEYEDAYVVKNSANIVGIKEPREINAWGISISSNENPILIFKEKA